MADALARLEVTVPAAGVPADGHSVGAVRLRLLDARGRSGKGRRYTDALTPRTWPIGAMCGNALEMATPGEVG